MLLIFGGLPASGKSTISKGVATEPNAVHVRVDTIEQTLKNEGFNKVYSEGYAIAYVIAADNLSLGSTVVADSVNSIKITRDAWRLVGESVGVPVIEIEIVCSDQEEHKRRIETRISNIERLAQPTWEEVLTQEYEPWIQEKYVIDSAGESPEKTVRKNAVPDCTGIN